jgi:hypothetical protein
MTAMEEHIIIIRTKISESAAEVTNKSSGQLITVGTAFGVAMLTGLIMVLVQLILK